MYLFAGLFLHICLFTLLSSFIYFIYFFFIFHFPFLSLSRAVGVLISREELHVLWSQGRGAAAVQCACCETRSWCHQVPAASAAECVPWIQVPRPVSRVLAPVPEP